MCSLYYEMVLPKGMNFFTKFLYRILLVELIRAFENFVFNIVSLKSLVRVPAYNLILN